MILTRAELHDILNRLISVGACWRKCFIPPTQVSIFDDLEEDFLEIGK